MPVVQIQNVVASAVFSQNFDLRAIAKAFPENTEFKEKFPGLVFKLEKPKTTLLLFKTGKTVCTGGRSEEMARRAILRAAQKLRREDINIAKKPEIQITNIVASATLDGVIDLDKLYALYGRGGNVLFEPEQFPALIYRWKNPNVVFLVFANGKIVCTGAKSEEDIHEAIENLQQKLEENEIMIRD